MLYLATLQSVHCYFSTGVVFTCGGKKIAENGFKRYGPSDNNELFIIGSYYNIHLLSSFCLKKKLVSAQKLLSFQDFFYERSVDMVE